MLHIVQTLLKRRATQKTRHVACPCSWCGTMFPLDQLAILRVRDEKVRVCSPCLEKLEM